MNIHKYRCPWPEDTNAKMSKELIEAEISKLKYQLSHYQKMLRNIEEEEIKTEIKEKII